MRPTTKRRLLMLFVGIVVLAVLGGGVVLIRMKQLDSAALQKRVDGMAAYQSGQYSQALDLLSDYLSIEKYKTDGDALYAMAVSRSMVTLPKSQHLLTAIGLLNNYLDLRKGDSQGQHKLLELYSRVRWIPEALSLSNEILAASPNDLPALRAKTDALTAQGHFDEALAVSKKINDIAPLDLETQRTTFSLMAQLKRPAPEMFALAKADLDAHPNDPRFELLMAGAYDYAGDKDNAQKYMLSAINRKAPDATFVKLATQMLDGGGSYDLSQGLLERAVLDLNDPAVLKMLVERQWQNGQLDDMAKRLEAVKSDDPNADTNLLAMKAISLLEHNQPAEALTIVKALATRTLDDEAFAWSTGIPAKYAVPAPTPHDAVQILMSAANRDANNSVVRLWLGDAYAKLGENDLAVKAWRSAGSLEPAWAEPHIRAAKNMALNGRSSEAYDEAVLAAQRSPKALQARVAFAMTLSVLSNDDPKSVSGDQLLQLVTAIQKEAPNEPQTLPMYVSILTQTNQRPQAIKVINQAIAANPAVPTDAMLNLAAVCGELKLDAQQQQIYDALTQAGDKSPELALAKARLLLAQGHADQGLQLMKDSAAGATDSAAWQIATAKYMDAAKNPDASIAWKNAVGQFPDDLRVQAAFLQSDSRATIRDTWASSIERIRALTLEDGVTWRVEHAKYLLSGNPTDKDRAEATTALTELIHSNADLVEPRLLLAGAMIKANNTSGAIDQLKFAAKLRPNDPQIALSLARLLLDNGNSVESQAYLEKLASSGVLAPSGVMLVAQMMADQGQADRAIQVLQSAPGSDPSRNALMAQLYRRLGRNDEAAGMFDKLAVAKPISTSAVVAASDYYFSKGKPDQANAVLARLSEATDPPAAGGAELIKAQLAEQYQSADAAKALYFAATKAASNAGTWQALASFQIRQHQFDDAKASLAQAASLNKADPSVAALQKLVDSASTVPAGVDINDEVSALSRDPLNEAQQTLLDAALASAAAKETPGARVARYKAIYDKYPKTWAANRELIRAYMDCNQLNNARLTCASAANAFPNDPAPLQMLAAVYEAQNDWIAELSAVQQWRTRALDNQRPCDVAAAEAMIGLGQQSQAIATLQPYIAAAKQNPIASMDVLWPYSRALLQLGRNAEVTAILEGPATKTASMRRLWLSLVGDVGPDNAAAVAWIEKFSPSLDLNSESDQNILAWAWFRVAERYNVPSSYANANKMLQVMAARPDSNSTIWAELGEGLRAVNDLPGAENAYRQAIARGDSTYSANALAFLLLTEDKSLDEALSLAGKAIDAAPRVAGYYDTRGQIYLHMGQYDSAIKDFDKAMSLQVDLTDSMVGKAEALKKSGQTAKAAEMMKYIDTVLSRKPGLSPYAQKQFDGLKAASAN